MSLTTMMSMNRCSSANIKWINQYCDVCVSVRLCVCVFMAEGAGSTQRILQVLLANQLQVFLNALGGQRVFPEDQLVVVTATVYLRHHQVR